MSKDFTCVQTPEEEDWNMMVIHVLAVSLTIVALTLKLIHVNKYLGPIVTIQANFFKEKNQRPLGLNCE